MARTAQRQSRIEEQHDGTATTGSPCRLLSCSRIAASWHEQTHQVKATLEPSALLVQHAALLGEAAQRE